MEVEKLNDHTLECSLRLPSGDRAHFHLLQLTTGYSLDLSRTAVTLDSAKPILPSDINNILDHLAHNRWGKKVCALSLRGQNIDVIPQAMFSLNNLKSLDLSSNKIENFSDRFSAIHLLESLNLNDNLLQNIPENVAYLIQLKKLNVSHNPIYLKETLLLGFIRLVNTSSNQLLHPHETLLKSLQEEVQAINALLKANQFSIEKYTQEREGGGLKDLRLLIRLLLEKNLAMEETYHLASLIEEHLAIVDPLHLTGLQKHYTRCFRLSRNKKRSAEPIESSSQPMIYSPHISPRTPNASMKRPKMDEDVRPPLQRYSSMP